MAPIRTALALAAVAWTVPAAAGPIDRWSAQIAEASSRFAIPADWIRRVMRVESGGRPVLNGRPVVSSAGAIGLMQLMPGTWRDMQSLLGLGSDPQEPRDNILAGAAYLRLMYDRFGYPGLFAAYNAGPSRYSAYLSSGRRLPRGTDAYVAAVAPTTAGASEVPRFNRRSATSSSDEPAALFMTLSTEPAREGKAKKEAASPGKLFVELTGSATR